VRAATGRRADPDGRHLGIWQWDTHVPIPWPGPVSGCGGNPPVGAAAAARGQGGALGVSADQQGPSALHTKGQLPLAASCFIDTMRPVTPGERLGWRVFLLLPAAHWKAGRTLFRHSHAGWDVGTNLMQFVSQTGIKDRETIALLEAALTALEKEAHNSSRTTRCSGRGA
jgi:hypothetical protein